MSPQSSPTHRSIRRKVLPDLLRYSRIDDDVLCFRGLLLGIQHQGEAAALRPERAGIKRVETFSDRLVLGDLSFEREPVNGRDLGLAAIRLHSGESGLDVLDRGHRHTL